MPYRRFAICTYTGGYLWTMIFINLGDFLGNRWHRFSGYSSRYIIPLAATALAISLVAIYFRSKKAGLLLTTDHN